METSFTQDLRFPSASHRPRASARARELSCYVLYLEVQMHHPGAPSLPLTRLFGCSEPVCSPDRPFLSTFYIIRAAAERGDAGTAGLKLRITRQWQLRLVPPTLRFFGATAIVPFHKKQRNCASTFLPPCGVVFVPYDTIVFLQKLERSGER